MFEKDNLLIVALLILTFKIYMDTRAKGISSAVKNGQVNYCISPKEQTESTLTVSQREISLKQ